MENEEVDRILYNVSRQGNSMLSLMLFAAQAQMQLFVFLHRMVSKALISGGALGKFESFLQKTEGKYDIYNIPVSEMNKDKVLRMQELERMIDEEKSPLKKHEYQKKIEQIKKETPELVELEKMGITHFALPKLNGGENTLQVAVGRGDAPKFKLWYMNHINDTLTGGALTFGELKTFTEGAYGIFNMPFEGPEVEKMLHDFEVLGINYTLLPDLNVGDGHTQIAVANKDQPGLDGWFQMWKEGKLASGEDPGDYKKISEHEYVQTAEMDAGDYIDGADKEYKDADLEFAQEGKAADAPKGQIEEMKSEFSEEFKKLESDPDLIKISINWDTLVNKDNFREPPGADRIRNTPPGYFLSRIPGTWGSHQETLVLPQSRVFTTDEGQTFVAFLSRKEKTMVITPENRIERRDFEAAYRPYHKVERNFKKVEGLMGRAREKAELDKGLGAKREGLKETMKKAAPPLPGPVPKM